MEFLLRKLNEPWPAIARYPAAALSRNNWDDYGYKTIFGVTLALSHDGLRRRLTLHPGKRYIDWDLPDPKGRPVEAVRPPATRSPAA